MEQQNDTMRKRPNDSTAAPCKDAQGRLPACGPLANPYVPFQNFAPEMYQAPFGLVRGTLFPGLDLPFLGKVNEEPLPESPLAELQALCFAINELALYLDTHTEDQEAIDLFHSYTELYQAGKKTYEQEYGPLTLMNAVQDGKYRWTQNPWPWDVQQPEQED